MEGVTVDFGSKDTVILNTGDVLRHEKVLSHLHQNSNEKLNCFLEKVAREGKVFERQGNIVSPKTSEVYEKKPNIKSTLKIFLQRYSSEDVREAVAVFQHLIGYPRVDQLIVSFPNAKTCNYMNRATSLWRDIEMLVESGIVLNLGAGNISFPDLVTLCNQANCFPPTVFHASEKELCAHSLNKIDVINHQPKVRIMAHKDFPPPQLTNKSWQIVQKITGSTHTGDTWISRYSLWNDARGIAITSGYSIAFT